MSILYGLVSDSRAGCCRGPCAGGGAAGPDSAPCSSTLSKRRHRDRHPGTPLHLHRAPPTRHFHHQLQLQLQPHPPRGWANQEQPCPRASPAPGSRAHPNRDARVGTKDVQEGDLQHGRANQGEPGPEAADAGLSCGARRGLALPQRLRPAACPSERLATWSPRRAATTTLAWRRMLTSSSSSSPRGQLMTSPLRHSGGPEGLTLALQPQLALLTDRPPAGPGGGGFSREASGARSF
ncbi:hypothetical protein AALO_G00268900 [Alosa alosa]|uniref:Uncharacterized protein n=1 Tax=Alosa alosa TaxID=278164 RepID=A0AAV6FRR5_9TELE|nr:hypothetical protein AALO_G00268900 [Alosa alosa]